MKKENVRHVLKLPALASVYYFGAAALTKIIGILSTPVFTRLLSADGYGEYTLYMSWLGFLSLCVTSLAAGSQGYAGLHRYKDKNSAYVSSLLGLMLGFCGIICILLFTFSSILGLKWDLISFLTVQLLCDCVLAVSYMRARYFYQFKRVCICSLIQALLSPLLAVILILRTPLGYLGRIYGLLIASVIVALPTLALLLRKNAHLYNKDIWSVMAKSYLPLMPQVVSNALSLQIDRFIISAVMGSEALGKYSVAHSIGAVLSVATSALGAALNPWTVRKISQNDTKSVSTVASRVFVMLGMASVVIVALAPEAMELLAPDKYSDSLPAVLPLALSTIPSFLVSISGVVLISRGDQRAVSITATVSVITGLLFGFIFIPTLGYFGAGAAHLLSQSIGAVLIIIFLRRQNVKDAVSARPLILSAIASSALAISAHLLHESLALRLIISLCALLVTGGVLYRSRELIREK